MNLLVEESVVLLFVVISLPVLVYTLQRITGKQVYKKWAVLLLYAVIFYIYIANIEKIGRGINDDYRLFVPEFMNPLKKL